MHGCTIKYRPPTVEDHGDLRQVTGAVHLLLGAGGMQGLSFSSPDGSVAGTVQQGGVGGQSGSASPNAATAASGGGTTGGGGVGTTGGGGGGGKTLPFTGLEVGIVAAVGSALATGGAALRKMARRRQG